MVSITAGGPGSARRHAQLRKKEVALKFLSFLVNEGAAAETGTGSPPTDPEEFTRLLEKAFAMNPEFSNDIQRCIGATRKELNESLVFVATTPEFKPKSRLNDVSAHSDDQEIAGECTAPDQDPSGTAVPQEELGATPDPAGNIELPEGDGTEEMAPPDGGGSDDGAPPVQTR